MNWFIKSELRVLNKLQLNCSPAEPKGPSRSKGGRTASSWPRTGGGTRWELSTSCAELATWWNCRCEEVEEDELGNVEREPNCADAPEIVEETNWADWLGEVTETEVETDFWKSEVVFQTEPDEFENPLNTTDFLTTDLFPSRNKVEAARVDLWSSG